ncbi:penicillin-binding protein activator [Candidatus Mcinerneyibacteriota bacterium]|nr:penicillin-binding protein activator [Candidatus Mcinerneyibacteriota bacterium]
MKRKALFLFAVVLWTGLVSLLPAQDYGSNLETVLDKIYMKAASDFRQGDFSEALQGFRDYMKAADPSDPRLADVFMSSGHIYRYALKYDKARAFYSEIIENFPDSGLNMWAQFYIARTYDEDGRFSQALDYYNNIVLSVTVEDNIKKIAQDQMAAILENELNTGELEKALLSLPPNPALKKAYVKLGQTLLDRKEYKRAEHIFSKMGEAGFTEESERFVRLARLKGEFPGAKIGCLLPLSGKYAQIGSRLFHAVSHAQDYKNRFLKEGQKLILLKADTQSELDRIPLLYEELVRQGASVVLGPVQSEAAELLKPYVDKYKVPVIFLMASDPEIPDKSPQFFRNSIRVADEAAALAEYGLKELKLTNLAVLVPDDSKGFAAGEVFKKKVTSYNAVLSVFETYNKGDTTYTPQLQRALDSFVDGLFVYGTNAKDLQQLMPSIPYVGLKVSVLADSTLFDDYLFRVLGDTINGTIIATYYNTADFGIMEKDIFDSFKKRYNYSLDQYTILGVDALSAAYEAVKISGGVSGEGRITEALHSLDEFRGLCGKISVLKNGDFYKKIFLYKVIDHRPEPVKAELDGAHVVEIP